MTASKVAIHLALMHRVTSLLTAAGIELPVVSVEGHLDTKVTWRRHSGGRALRRKDRAGIRYLPRLATLSASMPQPSGRGKGPPS